ncbi:MAG: hypothetical protein GC181_15825 [Bacteroidetes bacterium]|nr:hypothetical protein [Bacteroidota bacterium]
MPVHVLGIRHHGPGSSRHVLHVLEELHPDVILVEGPPEGDTLLKWFSHANMKPPVAMLAYATDNPKNAHFYPFTEYSPEWNAIRFAQEKDIPVRFMDLPLHHALAGTGTVTETVTETVTVTVTVTDQEIEGYTIDDKDSEQVKEDPFGYLAKLTGFDDGDLWWEHQVERAETALEVFDGITEVISALREEFPDVQKIDALREAWMRKILKSTEKEGFQNIVVVCGAWHVPALTDSKKFKGDNSLLKGLPKTKIEMTWVPWTYTRMSFHTGYGAGVRSPGWYRYLWQMLDDDGTYWLSKTAAVFRENATDVSSAHIIESVKLSNALAALRNYNKPGLNEHIESTIAVMCMGDDVLMKLIWRDLIVGSVIGEIPEGTPQAPIYRDFEKSVKSLRLKLSETPKSITLDLRKETDLQKSILFHRLKILKIQWAYEAFSRGKGTFKEEWTLQWDPEMVIELIEKAIWGNTIELAANQFLIHLAGNCNSISEISSLIEDAIPTELTTGIETALQRLDDLSASSSDIPALMAAFAPLVRIKRYGNVRNTDLVMISSIVRSVFYRILPGLEYAPNGINEEEALNLTNRIREVHDAVLLLEEEEFSDDWFTTIQKVADSEQSAPMVNGICCKILYDRNQFDEEETASVFGRSLSLANPPSASAAWIEGFLMDGASILLYDDVIRNIISRWLIGLNDQIFQEIIPLLRRTVSTYSPAEKRQLALKLQQIQSGVTEPDDTRWDQKRAQLIIPFYASLLELKKQNDE